MDDSGEISDEFLHSNDVWKATYGEIIFSAAVRIFSSPYSYYT